jgi:hypothetical protein
MANMPPENRTQIPVFKAKGDSGVYASSLKILPLVITQESPIKGSTFVNIQNYSHHTAGDGKSKIGVVGVTGGHLNLGTIDQFMSGALPTVLDLEAADTCTLRTTDAGLIWDVFWSTDTSKVRTVLHHSG